MLLQTQDTSPSCGDVEEKSAIPYGTEQVISNMRGRKEENHHTPFARRETKHRAGCAHGVPTPGPSQPPILQSPGIKQRVSTGLHFREENTDLNPNTGFDKDQMAQESPKIAKLIEDPPFQMCL